MNNRPTAVFPLCSHIKSNGEQCASPALHGMRFCFQHLGGTTSSLLRARSTTVNNADLDLAYPSNRESIQYNLDLVAQALAEGRIDTSIANTYNRIYRTCEQYLHRWEKAHKGETKMPSPPAGAPSFGAVSSRQRMGEGDRRTLLPLSDEQIERRSQIILKHQDRLDKITQQYQNYPNLTEILTSAMEDILQEEGETA
jgi:hypothetical protein